MNFLEWVDSEGGIWEMVMHGWSDSDLDALGMNMVQRQKLGSIKHYIEEADRLWDELSLELEEGSDQ